MKGLSGETLEGAVAAITAHKPTWIDTMLTGEYGLAAIMRSPLRAGLHTFFAFMLCGAIPLLPYLLGVANPLLWASLLTAVVFLGIGAAKSLWSLDHWAKSALETLAIGMGAAALAYLVGHLLRGLGAPAG
jgi:VIT1/CCC1 family predicted Fe2+/Mn2+ transporter